MVKTEVLYSYSYNIKSSDEFICDGTNVLLCKCIGCGKPILLEEDFTEIEGNYFGQERNQLYPVNENEFLKNAPEIIKRPYREALKCFVATSYEACVIMCRKGIEAICIEKVEMKGDLSKKLKNLKDKNLLEETFFNWANELRFIGNDGAHSHDNIILAQDAKDTLEFFKALITYLYYLVDQYEKLKIRRSKK